MKIITLSDTHGYHYYIAKSSPALPPGDVLVHAGDFTSHGKLYELVEFAKWLGAQDYKHKICIAGNHDECAEKMGYYVTHEIFEEHGVIYLEDTFEWVDGVKFYGTPYTPTFFDWSFMEDEHRLVERYATIPASTDVLITHGPAYGVCDTKSFHDLHNENGDRSGSKALLNRVHEVLPRLHITGHIHEGRGVDIDLPTITVNASFLDDNYIPFNVEQEVVEI